MADDEGDRRIILESKREDNSGEWPARRRVRGAPGGYRGPPGMAILG